MPTLGPLRRLSRALRRYLPPLNFIAIHYIYFVTTCLVASIVFWLSSTPRWSVGYTDSLFLTVSAMTLAGLNTVNLSTLNTFQQVLLFLLIIVGSAIFVSAFVVFIRKRTFEQRFEHIAAIRRRAGKNRTPSTSLARRLSKGLNRPSTQDGNQTINLPVWNIPNYNSDSRPEFSNDKVGTASDPIDVEGRPDGLATTHLESSHNARPTSVRTITYRAETGEEIQINQTPLRNKESGDSVPAHVTWGADTYYRAEYSGVKHQHHFNSMQGVGANPNASIKRRSTAVSPHRTDHHSEHNSMEVPTLGEPLSSSGFISRNSQFHHLSEKERQALGSTEYKAVQLLSWLVPTYSILCQLLGCIGLGAYVAINRASVARENGLNPWWVGAFNAVSAFNNSGMSLLDANMIAFQTSIYMLLTMGFLILAGNTAYPIFLRLIVWTLLKLLNCLPDKDRWNEHRKTLRFLLTHPRRCYTNMFPSRHTWWLLLCVMTLNGIDWAGFEILNIGNKKLANIPPNIRVIDGLFQAIAVRSGGFYVVPIPDVRIGLQVLYVIMMYISVYPVVITMRNSNVYEERSLGIYADDPGYVAAQAQQSQSGVFTHLRRKITGGSRPLDQTKSYFVRQQLRAQLAHDIWWLVLAVFLIMVIEGANFERQPTVYSVFNVIFETVSAYGCVGISVGLPDQAYSFSGGLSKGSKLVLCGVMIRGRHRGLPVAIDKAVLLPGEELHEAEEEDAMIRMERTVSRGRVV